MIKDVVLIGLGNKSLYLGLFNIILSFGIFKVSISYFFNLWRGTSWPNIHMDVYTDENKEYYKNLINESSYKSSYNSVKFTDEGIININVNGIKNHCAM